MTLYASASAKGFFDSAIHGERTLLVADPDWARPTVKVPDPHWTRPMREIRLVDGQVLADGDEPADDAEVELSEVVDLAAEHPLIDAPDLSAIAPLVEVDNSACRLPEDAVEITPEHHRALLDGQAAGQVIDFAASGGPALVARAGPTTEQLLARLRADRDLALKACDWTMLNDAALSAGEVRAWITYREALRNLPADFADKPGAVVWPVAPT